MSLIAVLNSRPEVQNQIDKALSHVKPNEFSIHKAFTQDEAKDALMFDLPEIVILNVDDPELSLESMIKTLQSDSWMNNFGVIALYDRRLQNETEASEKLHKVNVLTILSYEAILDNLFKHLSIIEANKQILVQMEIGGDLSFRSTGSFNIENDPLVVPIYAGLAAQNLVQRGLLPLNRKRDLQIALTELLQNGIEHGNCGLTASEKSDFLAHGGSIVDLIRLKCNSDHKIASSRVTLEWEIRTDFSHFYIRDEGQGFDVLAYKENLKSHKKDQLSGRGIRLARKIGGKLSYNKVGNVACLSVDHQMDEDRENPKGFEGEEVVVVKKGDFIFRQGEMSDHLFYMISGTYGVYHDGVALNLLTPADVFMGEMAFLMSNVRTATVICETPGRIIKIARKSFVKTLRQYPHYGFFLAKLMARKLSDGNQKRARQVLDELSSTLAIQPVS